MLYVHVTPDSKVPGANMGPTWGLSAPDGPHVGPGTLLSGTWYSKRLDSDHNMDEVLISYTDE